MQMFRVKAIAVMVESATDCFVENADEILAGRTDPKFQVIKSSKAANLCSRLKKFDRRYGYKHPDVLRLELEGNNHIRFIMDAFWTGINCKNSDPFAGYAYRRISENYRRVYESGEKTLSDKLHLLCDEVSGMTESYLISVHDELKNLLAPSQMACKVRSDGDVVGKAASSLPSASNSEHKE